MRENKTENKLPLIFNSITSFQREERRRNPKRRREKEQPKRKKSPQKHFFLLSSSTASSVGLLKEYHEMSRIQNHEMMCIFECLTMS